MKRRVPMVWWMSLLVQPARPVAPRVVMTRALRAEIAARAAAFIRHRYRMDADAAARLNELPIRWRRGNGRSAFYKRSCRGFEGPHILLRVPRGATARWHTYRRVRAKWVTPPRGVELPLEVLMTVVLIHEYTHAVQHGICGGAPRKYSEVETTANELEYIRQVVPAAYSQLMPIAPGRRMMKPVRVKSARPAGAHGFALRLLRGIVVRYQAARAAAHPAAWPLDQAH